MKNKQEILKTAKPILFNTEMVKAISDGRKVQTRRVLVSSKYCDFTDIKIGDKIYPNGRIFTYKCLDREMDLFEDKFIAGSSKYKKGDVLYVRETFTAWGERILYKADGTVSKSFMNDVGIKWKPSIHMPKKYARLFLKVTDVRVEKLQDITTYDLQNEGCPLYTDALGLLSKATKRDTKACIEMLEWWTTLWNSTAKDGYKWEDNPYVFVYDFEVLS